MKNILKLGLAASMLCSSLAYGVDQVTISGRLQPTIQSISTDYSGAQVSPHTVNEFILRRVYLGVDADLGNEWSGNITTRFNDTDGGSSLQKAIVSYNKSDLINIDFGYKKVGIGYEETTSSKSISTVERSIATRYFLNQLDLGGRLTGVHVNGNWNNGFYYQAALTNPTQENVGSNNGADSNVLAVTARLGYTGTSGAATYDVGGYMGLFDEQNGAQESNVWGLYGNVQVGMFDVTAELISANIETAASDSDPTGFYVTPVFKLNDKVDLVVRYSNVDSDSGLIDISDTTPNAAEADLSAFGSNVGFDEASSWYFGGNWYLEESIKVTFGYEFSNYEGLQIGLGDADVDAFRARLQLLF